MVFADYVDIFSEVRVARLIWPSNELCNRMKKKKATCRPAYRRSKSQLVAIARIEVKQSMQYIIKVKLNGFKVRVKARPLFLLIVDTLRKRFGD